MILQDLFNLEGKTAIVTGGAGYLGTAISEALAEAGADVVIASRNLENCKQLSESISKTYGVHCEGVSLDVMNSTSVTDCLKKVMKKHHSIDILVNNAFFGASGQIDTMSEEDWNKGIEGTINGVFKCVKAVVPYMIMQKGGSIINISSMYGVVSPNPEIYENKKFNNPPNYGAGKAAIIQFTRYIACYYGMAGIRANSISPGPFPNQEVQQDKSFIEHLNKKNPLGRIGKPSDLKGITVLLASEASSYITGQNICIDGGWTSW